MGVVDGCMIRQDCSSLRMLCDGKAAYVIDLTMTNHRKKISTNDDILQTNGRRAIRNADGTGMTLAQIATAANLTVAQVTDIAGRL
jgi:hypothetical protein